MGVFDFILYNQQIMQLMAAFKVSRDINSASEKTITFASLKANKILTFEYDSSTYKVSEANE